MSSFDEALRTRIERVVATDTATGGLNASTGSTLAKVNGVYHVRPPQNYATPAIIYSFTSQPFDIYQAGRIEGHTCIVTLTILVERVAMRPLNLTTSFVTALTSHFGFGRRTEAQSIAAVANRMRDRLMTDSVWTGDTDSDGWTFSTPVPLDSPAGDTDSSGRATKTFRFQVSLAKSTTGALAVGRGFTITGEYTDGSTDVFSNSAPYFVQLLQGVSYINVTRKSDRYPRLVAGEKSASGILRICPKLGSTTMPTIPTGTHLSFDVTIDGRLTTYKGYLNTFNIDSSMNAQRPVSGLYAFRASLEPEDGDPSPASQAVTTGGFGPEP